MTKGIIISEHGNPEVMKWGPVELPEVGPEDVLIKFAAMIDTILKNVGYGI